MFNRMVEDAKEHYEDYYVSLELANPEKTKGLQGFLPLYRGMKLMLSSKDCVKLGIVKGCPCTLEEIILADDIHIVA